MSVTVEKLEHNMAKITFAVSGKEFEEAYEAVYRRNQPKITVPGYPQGKVPRNVFEETYGKEVFYEDAVNALLPAAYDKAVRESGLVVTSKPVIDIESLSFDEGITFTAEVAVKPEVTLGKYLGIEVHGMPADVSEDEINEAIEADRKIKSRQVLVENRPAQEGDIVNLDYRGTIDGIVFDGGTAEGFDLEIGSHMFIDTFEDQIAGHTAGDEFNVYVTFPQEYHAEEFAGKKAVFAVKINVVKTEELPEIDDEYIYDLGYETFAEYRSSIEENLLKRKQRNVREAMEAEIVETIAENSLIDIPAPMIEVQCDESFDNYKQQLESQGWNAEEYLAQMGFTEDEVRAQLMPQAEKNIRNRLVLEAIADKEQITVSNEEVDTDIRNMADQYGVDMDTVKKIINIEELITDIKVQKATDLVYNAAVMIP